MKGEFTATPGNRESTVSPQTLPPRRAGFASIPLLVLVLLAGAAGAPARGKKLVWKPVSQVLLKENNRPVKNWNVYWPDKNHNLVLVQLEGNWFLFNLKQKRVYRAERSEFQTRGEALIGPIPGSHAQIVKTESWNSHDVGPAQQIVVRFAATGDELAIELPHPLAIY